jgi:hypothetical protein
MLATLSAHAWELTLLAAWLVVAVLVIVAP